MKKMLFVAAILLACESQSINNVPLKKEGTQEQKIDTSDVIELKIDSVGDVSIRGVCEPR